MACSTTNPAITLPSTLSSISPNAFESCSGLRSLTLPENVTFIGVGAFKHCRALTTVTIPNSVGGLYDYAFFMCTGLQTVTIGSSVDYIGVNAFALCPNLQTLQFEGNAPATFKSDALAGSTNAAVTYWSGTTGWQGITNVTVRPQPFQYALLDTTAVLTGYTGSGGDIVLPTTIEGFPLVSVEDYAFMNQTNVVSVTIPPAVTYVGDYAFASCSGLKNITLSEALTYVGEGAFNQCSSMTNIALPDRVASVGNGVFSECQNLTHVTLGHDLGAIPHDAFFGCSRLLQIDVDEQNPALYSQDGVLFARTPQTLLIYPQGRTGRYVVPEGIQRIAMHAFAYAQVSKIVLASTVQTIDGYSFWGCDNLSQVVLSANLSMIGDSAFAQCPVLQHVFCPGTPPSVGTAVFDTTHDTRIYYLANASGWSSSHAGLPTALWNPVLQITTSPRTVTVTGYEGMRVALESSTNLTHWTVLSTNVLVKGSQTFALPENPETARFYRAVERPE